MDALLTITSTNKKTDALRASLKHDKTKRLATCFLLCLVVFAPMILTNAPGDTVDDDWLIACYLSPCVPDGALCLFINALLAQFVSGLGNLCPFVNWFQTFELAVGFAAFFCLIYYSLKYLELPYSAFLFTCLVLLSLPGCTYLQKFTIVAGTLAIVGGFLLILSLCESDFRAGVIGGILVVVGTTIRQDAVLIGVPFFLGLAIFAFFRFPNKAKRIQTVRLLALLILAILLVCVILNLYSEHVWSVSPWSDWRTYNAARSIISDFPMPPYDEIAEQLSDIGISANDYAMMQNWMVSDTDVFTLEKMQEVALLQKAYFSPSIATVFLNTMRGLSQEPILIVMAIFVVGLYLYSRCTDRLAWAALLVSFAGSFLICFYFQWMGRMLARIYYLVWLNFVFSSVLILHYAQTSNTHRQPTSKSALGVVAKKVIPIAYIIVGMCLVGQTYSPVIREFNAIGFMNYSVQQQEANNYLTLYRDAESIDKDSTRFVYQARARKLLERAYQLKTIPNTHYFTHNIALGEWAVGSPQLSSIYHEIEWSNPYTGLLSDEDAILVVTEERYADMTRTFLREHYNQNADYIYLESITAYDTELRLYQFTAAP